MWQLPEDSSYRPLSPVRPAGAFSSRPGTSHSMSKILANQSMAPAHSHSPSREYSYDHEQPWAETARWLSSSGFKCAPLPAPTRVGVRVRVKVREPRQLHEMTGRGLRLSCPRSVCGVRNLGFGFQQRGWSCNHLTQSLSPSVQDVGPLRREHRVQPHALAGCARTELAHP